MTELFYVLRQTSYVRRQLKAVELDRCDWRHVNRFVVDYLRRDGLLLVRLVSKNVGELTAAELLCALWNRHGTTFSVDPTAAAAAAAGDSKDGRTGRRRKLAAHRAAGDGSRTQRLAANDDGPVRQYYTCWRRCTGPIF